MKPSILIIADFPNWAYFEIQQFIKNNLSKDFRIYLDYMIFNTKKKTRNPFKRMELIFKKHKYQETRKDNKYDIVFYLGFYFDKLMLNKYITKKIIKGIYTSQFPPQNINFNGNFDDFVLTYLQNCDAIICGSENILDIYKKSGIPSYNLNSVKDVNLFKRINDKKINSSKKFVIGWTGNPKRRFKGFYSHIIPSIKLVQNKYPEIEFKTRFSGSFNTLPRFFENVDLVLIASHADADPSLFGEASLMEVPCITTNLGRISDVVIDGENGFIVNKDIDEISEKIIYCYENRNQLFKMSKQIRRDFISVFDPSKTSIKWKIAFNEILNQIND